MKKQYWLQCSLLTSILVVLNLIAVIITSNDLISLEMGLAFSVVFSAGIAGLFSGISLRYKDGFLLSHLLGFIYLVSGIILPLAWSGLFFELHIPTFVFFFYVLAVLITTISLYLSHKREGYTSVHRY